MITLATHEIWGNVLNITIHKVYLHVFMSPWSRYNAHVLSLSSTLDLDVFIIQEYNGIAFCIRNTLS